MSRIIIWCYCCCLLAACSFLDVDTPGLVDRRRMFSDEQGYKDALTGIYASLTAADLYGNSLSFGFVDELAQYYYNDYERVPSVLTKTYDLRYDDREVRLKVDRIWELAYRSIAAINHLLDHIHQGSSPQLQGFMGEALALRAFLHFDLLRLFGPLPGQFNAVAIPYVSSSSAGFPTSYLTAEACMEAILRDLHKAHDLLKEKVSEGVPLYVNQSAVKALLARVYLWKQNYQEAARYAREVLEAGYRLSTEEELSTLFMGYNAKQECIWALHAPRHYLDIRTLFFPTMRTNRLNMVRDRHKELFQVQNFTPSNNDYRYQAYFTYTTWGKEVVTFTKLYDKNYDGAMPATATHRMPCINLLRLPEQYYILAESLWHLGNREASLQMLNQVITSRGLRPLQAEQVSTRTLFERVLLQEISKEYWGEGQLFFAHKRLLWEMEGLHGKRHEPTEATFVLPLPENEKAYE